MVTEKSELEDLRALLAETYRPVSTRDRKVALPVKYTLVRALRNESLRDWKGYFLKLHQLAEHCGGLGPDFRRRGALTGATGAARRRALRADCNEWLLFHGTSQAAAEAIGKKDFKMQYS